MSVVCTTYTTRTPGRGPVIIFSLEICMGRHTEVHPANTLGLAVGSCFSHEENTKEVSVGWRIRGMVCPCCRMGPEIPSCLLYPGLVPVILRDLQGQHTAPYKPRSDPDTSLKGRCKAARQGGRDDCGHLQEPCPIPGWEWLGWNSLPSPTPSQQMCSQYNRRK